MDPFYFNDNGKFASGTLVWINVNQYQPFGNFTDSYFQSQLGRQFILLGRVIDQSYFSNDNEEFNVVFVLDENAICLPIPEAWISACDFFQAKHKEHAALRREYNRLKDLYCPLLARTGGGDKVKQHFFQVGDWVNIREENECGEIIHILPDNNEGTIYLVRLSGTRISRWFTLLSDRLERPKITKIDTKELNKEKDQAHIQKEEEEKEEEEKETKQKEEEKEEEKETKQKEEKETKQKEEKEKEEEKETKQREEEEKEKARKKKEEEKEEKEKEKEKKETKQDVDKKKQFRVGDWVVVHRTNLLSELAKQGRIVEITSFNTYKILFEGTVDDIHTFDGCCLKPVYVFTNDLRPCVNDTVLILDEFPATKGTQNKQGTLVIDDKDELPFGVLINNKIYYYRENQVQKVKVKTNK